MTDFEFDWSLVSYIKMHLEEVDYAGFHQLKREYEGVIECGVNDKVMSDVIKYMIMKGMIHKTFNGKYAKGRTSASVLSPDCNRSSNDEVSVLKKKLDQLEQDFAEYKRTHP